MTVNSLLGVPGSAGAPRADRAFRRRPAANAGAETMVRNHLPPRASHSTSQSSTDHLRLWRSPQRSVGPHRRCARPRIISAAVDDDVLDAGGRNVGSAKLARSRWRCWFEDAEFGIGGRLGADAAPPAEPERAAPVRAAWSLAQPRSRNSAICDLRVRTCCLRPDDSAVESSRCSCDRLGSRTRRSCALGVQNCLRFGIAPRGISNETCAL